MNMQNSLPVFALAPDADRYNANPATDIINMADYTHCNFFLHEGAGGTGTVKLIVQACDDVSATATTDLAFRYRVAQTGDTFGAWTEIAATGYTTVAGANKIVQVEVDNQQLPDGKPYVRLSLTEVANDPCDAGVLAVLSGPRYGAESPATALV